jgi:hypothetical protein
VTSQEAYISFLNLANKLNSNDNINIDIGRFVLLYNKNAKIWLELRVGKTKASQKIDALQQLIVEHFPLVQIITTHDHTDFLLPDNWFDHIGGYALCTRDGCSNRVINASQVKNDEKRLVLFDENWRPDFDFEWLPITIGEDRIQVFFNNFTVNQFFIDYFRYPIDIDIAGYIKPDNITPSTNINPDLADIYVNEIIDLVVADVSRIYQNNEKVQLDLNRIQQEK